MAIGPIDYSGMTTQLDVSPLLDLQRSIQAKKATDAINQQRQAQILIAQQKQEGERAKEREYKDRVAGVMADPTTQNFQRLLLDFPEQASAIKAAADQQTGAQKTRNVQAAMRLGGFVNNGLVDQAIADLQERKAALVENGESTEITDAAIAALKAGDTTKAKALAGIVIAGTLGEDSGDVLDALGYSAKAKAAERREERAERAEERADRRLSLSEDANARADRASARADASAARSAAKGGKSSGGKPTKLPAGFILD